MSLTWGEGEVWSTVPVWILNSRFSNADYCPFEVHNPNLTFYRAPLKTKSDYCPPEVLRPNLTFCNRAPFKTMSDYCPFEGLKPNLSFCNRRREIITVRGQSYVSRLPKYWPPPPNNGGGYTLAGPRGGWGGGLIFWKTRDIGLPSYSNNLSTVTELHSRPRSIIVRLKFEVKEIHLRPCPIFVRLKFLDQI